MTLHGIQYLRAAAAIAVVLFHAAEKTGYHFAIGAAGVDVFFVISGFIMWVIGARRESTPLEFLSARLRRIVPVYWLATGVMIAGGLAGLFPNLELTIEHVVASLFFIPARSPSTGEIWPVLVQGWTLNYEMFFYAVFAASLLLPRSWQLPTIAFLFTALTFAGFLGLSDNAILVTYTRPVILEFVAGMVLGQAWLRARVPSRSTGLWLVGISIAGFAFIGIRGLPFDALICGPLSMALVLGVLALENTGGLPRAALPGFLGDASYSIYLWHTFAISVVAKLGSSLSVPPAAIFLIATVSGILIGIVAYRLLEQPVHQFTRRLAQ